MTRLPDASWTKRDDLAQLIDALGRAAHDYLAQQGVSVGWHDYPMGHEVVQAEIADIASWLRAREQGGSWLMISVSGRPDPV